MRVASYVVQLALLCALATSVDAITLVNWASTSYSASFMAPVPSMNAVVLLAVSETTTFTNQVILADAANGTVIWQAAYPAQCFEQFGLVTTPSGLAIVICNVGYAAFALSNGAPAWNLFFTGALQGATTSPTQSEVSPAVFLGLSSTKSVAWGFAFTNEQPFSSSTFSGFSVQIDLTTGTISTITAICIDGFFSASYGDPSLDEMILVCADKAAGVTLATGAVMWTNTLPPGLTVNPATQCQTPGMPPYFAWSNSTLQQTNENINPPIYIAAFNRAAAVPTMFNWTYPTGLAGVSFGLTCTSSFNVIALAVHQSASNGVVALQVIGNGSVVPVWMDVVFTIFQRAVPVPVYTVQNFIVYAVSSFVQVPSLIIRSLDGTVVSNRTIGTFANNFFSLAICFDSVANTISGGIGSEFFYTFSYGLPLPGQGMGLTSIVENFDMAVASVVCVNRNAVINNANGEVVGLTLVKSQQWGLGPINPLANSTCASSDSPEGITVVDGVTFATSTTSAWAQDRFGNLIWCTPLPPAVFQTNSVTLGTFAQYLVINSGLSNFIFDQYTGAFIKVDTSFGTNGGCSNDDTQPVTYTALGDRYLVITQEGPCALILNAQLTPTIYFIPGGEIEAVSPVPGALSVLLGLNGGGLVRLDVTTGALSWNNFIASDGSTSLLSVGPNVAFSTVNGIVTAYQVANGNVLWTGLPAPYTSLAVALYPLGDEVAVVLSNFAVLRMGTAYNATGANFYPVIKAFCNASQAAATTNPDFEKPSILSAIDRDVVVLLGGVDCVGCLKGINITTGQLLYNTTSGGFGLLACSNLNVMPVRSLGLTLCGNRIVGFNTVTGATVFTAYTNAQQLLNFVFSAETLIVSSAFFVAGLYIAEPTVLPAFKQPLPPVATYTFTLPAGYQPPTTAPLPPSSAPPLLPLPAFTAWQFVPVSILQSSLNPTVTTGTALTTDGNVVMLSTPANTITFVRATTGAVTQGPIPFSCDPGASVLAGVYGNYAYTECAGVISVFATQNSTVVATSQPLHVSTQYTGMTVVGGYSAIVYAFYVQVVLTSNMSAVCTVALQGASQKVLPIDSGRFGVGTLQGFTVYNAATCTVSYSAPSLASFARLTSDPSTGEVYGASLSIKSQQLNIVAVSASGAQLWNIALPQASYLPFSIIVASATRLVLPSSNAAGAIGLDRVTGAPKWFFSDAQVFGCGLVKGTSQVALLLPNSNISVIDSATGRVVLSVNQGPSTQAGTTNGVAAAAAPTAGYIAIATSAGYAALINTNTATVQWTRYSANSNTYQSVVFASPTSFNAGPVVLLGVSMTSAIGVDTIAAPGYAIASAAMASYGVFAVAPSANILYVASDTLLQAVVGSTGSPIWTSTLPGQPPAYTTGAPASVAVSANYIAVRRFGGVAFFDITDGSLVSVVGFNQLSGCTFTADGTQDLKFANPDDRLVMASGGCVFIILPNGTVAFTIAVATLNPLVVIATNVAISADGFTATFSDNQGVGWGINLKTGAVVWQQLFAPLSTGTGTNGNVFVVTGGAFAYGVSTLGTVVCVYARTGAVVWRATLANSVVGLQPPLLLGNMLIVTGEQRLYALHTDVTLAPNTTRVAWVVALKAPTKGQGTVALPWVLRSRPVASIYNMVISSQASQLSAVDPRTGKVQWNTAVPAPCTSIALSGGQGVASCGRTVVFNVATGNITNTLGASTVASFVLGSTGMPVAVATSNATVQTAAGQTIVAVYALSPAGPAPASSSAPAQPNPLETLPPGFTPVQIPSPGTLLPPTSNDTLLPAPLVASFEPPFAQVLAVKGTLAIGFSFFPAHNLTAYNIQTGALLWSGIPNNVLANTTCDGEFSTGLIFKDVKGMLTFAGFCQTGFDVFAAMTGTYQWSGIPSNTLNFQFTSTQPPQYDATTDAICVPVVYPFVEEFDIDPFGVQCLSRTAVYTVNCTLFTNPNIVTDFSVTQPGVMGVLYGTSQDGENEGQLFVAGFELRSITTGRLLEPSFNVTSNLQQSSVSAQFSTDQNFALVQNGALICVLDAHSAALLGCALCVSVNIVAAAARSSSGDVFVVVTLTGTSTIQVFSLSSPSSVANPLRTPLWQYVDPTPSDQLFATPVSDFVLICDEASMLMNVSLRTGDPFWTVRNAAVGVEINNVITIAAVSPDAGLLLTFAQNTIALWSTSSGSLISAFFGSLPTNGNVLFDAATVFSTSANGIPCVVMQPEDGSIGCFQLPLASVPYAPGWIQQSQSGASATQMLNVGNVVLGVGFDNVRAFDFYTGAPLWAVQGTQTLQSQAVLVNGFLFMPGTTGQLLTINVNNGTIAATAILPLCQLVSVTIGGVLPQVFGNRVFFSSNAGCAYLATIGDMGAITVLTRPISTPSTALSLSSAAAIYIDSTSFVWCFDPITLAPRWSYQLPSAVSVWLPQPIAYGRYVYMAESSVAVVGIDSISGALIMRAAVNNVGVLYAYSGNLFVATSTGVVKLDGRPQLDPLANRTLFAVTPSNFQGFGAQAPGAFFTNTKGGLIIAFAFSGYIAFDATTGAVAYQSSSSNDGIGVSLPYLVVASADGQSALRVYDVNTHAMLGVAPLDLFFNQGASIVAKTGPEGTSYIAFSLSLNQGTSYGMFALQRVAVATAAPVSTVAAPMASLPSDHIVPTPTVRPSLPPGDALPPLGCEVTVAQQVPVLTACINSMIAATYLARQYAGTTTFACGAASALLAQCAVAYSDAMGTECGAGVQYLGQVLDALKASPATPWCGAAASCTDGTAGANQYCAALTIPANATLAPAGGAPLPPNYSVYRGPLPAFTAAAPVATTAVPPPTMPPPQTATQAPSQTATQAPPQTATQAPPQTATQAPPTTQTSTPSTAAPTPSASPTPRPSSSSPGTSAPTPTVPTPTTTKAPTTGTAAPTSTSTAAPPSPPAPAATMTFTVDFGTGATLNQAALEERLTNLLNLGPVSVRILSPSSGSNTAAGHTVTFTIVSSNANAQASALLALPPTTVCATLNALSFSPVDTNRGAPPAEATFSTTAIAVVAVLAVLLIGAVVALVVQRRTVATAREPVQSARELSWRDRGNVNGGERSSDLYAPLNK